VRSLGFRGEARLHHRGVRSVLGEGSRMSEIATTASEPERSFSFIKVEHTGITVSSLDAALDFWVRVLGFKHLYTWEFEATEFIAQMVGVPGAAMRLAMVEGPGHWIELLEYTAPADRQVYRPRSSDVGSVHIGFYVTCLDALLERVSQEGWAPVGQVQTVAQGERKGLRIIYVRGPDGVTIEFLEPPQDAAN
jgi:catechol 2,3-dioxygenase-like lactoylglutathione lyase family enzyme